MKYGEIEITFEGYPKEMLVWDNEWDEPKPRLVICELEHEKVCFPYVALDNRGYIINFRYAKDIK